MKTIAVANHKGGVGKTATAHALAVCLAQRYKVLLLDIDPQGTLTNANGINAPGGTMAAVIEGTPLADVLVKVDGLTLAPAGLDLAVAELALTSRLGRENVLKRALAEVSGFDVCIIDCAPSLGLLTVNALTAADGVIVPTIPQVADLRGLRSFLDTLDQLKAELNPSLELIGVLITFFDSRLNHHNSGAAALRTAGLPLFDTMIGRSVRVAEAMAVGQSVVTFEPGNKQAQAYTEFSLEVTTWLRKNR